MNATSRASARSRLQRGLAAFCCVAGLVAGSNAWTQAAPASPTAAPRNFEPRLGQSGKDVMWLPSKEAMVERLLQMGEVTRRDYLVDLGSGDGKIPILAARTRGARGLGVEFNPEMVELSRRRAAEQGVADKVEFRVGDIFQADYAAATVVYLYLLPELNLRLRPALLKMTPGTRILSNGWDMQTWIADETSAVDNAKAYLWIVPAHVGGSWQIRIKARGAVPPAELTLRQRFQRVSGEADFRKFSARLQDVVLRGDALRFSYRDANGEIFEFVGKVQGDRIKGTAQSRSVRGTFEATRTGTAEFFPEAVGTSEEMASAVRVLGNQ
jgi:hypothetical protein